MLKNHIRTWSSWSVFVFLLIGIGFALDAWLPPQPRFVLLGDGMVDNRPSTLSPDGKILTTLTVQRPTEGVVVYQSIKTWDTISGFQRGEFFRDVIESAPRLPIAIGTLEIEYSPDHRYCALVHAHGLTLADLHVGKQLPKSISWTDAQIGPPHFSPLYALLRQSIETKGLEEKVKLKTALEYISDKTGGKLPILVDRDAFAAELGPKAADPYEEEVCLPPVPAKMNINTALRLILSQVGKGSATFLVRRNFIEITTTKRRFEDKVLPPVFSARGSFLLLAEGGKNANKLHVVECATGQLLTSLATHPEALEIWGFTPDEEMLYFFAPVNGNPLFTVWNMRTRQVARTIEGIALATSDTSTYVLAPNGTTLVVDAGENESGGVDLVDLQTGRKRRCFDVSDKSTPPKDRGFCQNMFSSDNRTLLRVFTREMQICDMSSGKIRWSIKHDRVSAWSIAAISPDLRVLCALSNRPRSAIAWSVETGDRLWPQVASAPEIKNVPPTPVGQEVLEEINGGLAVDSRQFTPDGRFLVERTKDRIDIVDVVTGAVNASLSLGRNASPAESITFTPDGRAMLTWWHFEREPWLAEKWLGEWWPLKRSGGCLMVADLATGQVAFRMNYTLQNFPNAFLSDDGQTLITHHGEDGTAQAIYVWDVPSRPSLLLVFGIPIAVAGSVVFLRCWVKRKNGKKTSIVANSEIEWN